MHIIVTENESDQRFDRFLRKYFKSQKEIKLGDIFSRIRKGAIKLNKRKRSEKWRIQTGDIITWDDRITTDKNAADFRRSKKEKIKNYPIEKIKNILIFEDENWLVFDKPADIVMHPGTGHNDDISLHDMMKVYLFKNNKLDKETTFKPSFCFRLDRDTSGIVIAAKTYKALQYLNEKIRNREISKMYVTIVSGKFIGEKTIDTPLFKGFDKKSGRAKVFVNYEQGKTAKTTARVLKTIKHPHLGDISFLEIKIYTGRMHQIRVHLSSIGYPVIGDMMYGISAINRIADKQEHVTRQLLHSVKYGFFDPFQHKEIVFKTKLPKIFSDLFSSL